MCGVSCFVFWIPDFRFRVSDFWFQVLGFRFRISDFGFLISGFRFRGSGSARGGSLAASRSGLRRGTRSATTQRLAFQCQTTSASTAPGSSKRMVCPTSCAIFCDPCQPPRKSGYTPISRMISGGFSSKVAISCATGKPIYHMPSCVRPRRNSRIRVTGFGFRISGFGSSVPGFKFRVPGFGYQESRVGLYRQIWAGDRVSCFGFQDSGFGFRTSNFGFRLPKKVTKRSSSVGKVDFGRVSCSKTLGVRAPGFVFRVSGLGYQEGRVGLCRGSSGR